MINDNQIQRRDNRGKEGDDENVQKDSVEVARKQQHNNIIRIWLN